MYAKRNLLQQLKALNSSSECGMGHAKLHTPSKMSCQLGLMGQVVTVTTPM